ncbi:hypothetical protein I302_103151 [Kwoniella bestiolae CBS 10118]|uniref:Ricin B lectin domain-containing protein n=1 Tax=Kwoniella bestiolae CBS 10118 TaxID=1296100 RepID=A0A1B9G7K6_9TREE|nr:hypothetical protein I302_01849 [Kwoniella bestiolae CBS 10118]OCF27014.1 hypothetical protein I302_01849 [Kwoniella bestiolae CBS 10118]
MFIDIPIMLILLPTLLPRTLAASLTKRYSSVKIQSYRSLKCLSPVAPPAEWQDGTRVTTVNCSSAVEWDINPGSDSILISGTQWALDAGTGDEDNAIIKVWTSYPGLFRQIWYLTDDDRIAITNGSQCLDEGLNGPQTYTCTTGNANQVWTIIATTPTTPGVQPSIPSGPVYVDHPISDGRRIHPYGRPDLCVMVGNGVASVNQLVDISYCLPDTSPYAHLQLWNISLNIPSRVSLQAHPSLCLDAGQHPINGARLTTYGCGSSSTRQNWLWDGTTLALNSNNRSEAYTLCLDVELNSPRTPQQPYDRLERLQTWTCYEGNRQQIFTVFGDDDADDC